MKIRLLILTFLLSVVSSFTSAQRAGSSIDLSGSWLFKVDSSDAGVSDRWFTANLTDTIILPGSMAQNGKGDDVSVDTKWTGGIVDKSWYTDEKYAKYRQPGNVKVPFWLNPVKVYVGPAWYQKHIDVPTSWKGKHIVLTLERCHWESRLWIDDREIGINNSLSTPHEYDLSRMISPGRHTLTLRIDNRIKDIDVGHNAHSVSDHTQTNWNGIVGRIELRASSPVRIAGVTIVPDLRSKSVHLKISLVNETGNRQSGIVMLSAKTIHPSKHHAPGLQKISFDIEGEKTTVEGTYAMGDTPLLWDEFNPHLYMLQVDLQTSELARDRKRIQFGMREFKAEGTRFFVNGRPVFLRGTLECAIFPKTGYASMDIREWTRIFKVCKSYGLNHVRFHSWCPPEAAFDAADREGIYLYVECCAWAEVGDGKPIDTWLFEESERIVREFGNHPSFCMMSYGNEPSGKNQSAFLGRFVKYWEEKDRRRVYTSAAGWPQIPESDFHISDAPRIQRWGAGLNSSINKEPPTTDFDFREIIAKYDKPVVSHEIGQWCVYPNLKEIGKYTGVLRAKNFEIFRESLGDHHMMDQADAFLSTSGKLQTLCYKADIEAALRTPGMAGFELLDLHDFPGQGTALVGVLDPFWQEKGYVTSKEYSRFCNSTVPLARMKKRIFASNEEFSADIEVAHFGPAAMKEIVPRWKVRGAKGKVVASGTLHAADISINNSIPLGTIRLPLSGIQRATKLNLEVKIGQFSNDWDFWVYPANLPPVDCKNVLVATELNAETELALLDGKTILLLADTSRINSNVPPGFSSIFWNTAWTSKQPPHTLGILCDPHDSALKYFPTEYHSNWQWWDLVTNSRAMILDSLPSSFRPIVQIVDDWVTNRKLGLVFEAKVGKGKLLVCSIDLSRNLDRRPVARQLLYSLQNYVTSSTFSPSRRLELVALRSIFKSDASH